MIETFDSLPLQLTFTGTWERSTVTPYSGTHCLKSGNIGDGMTSSAFLTVDLPKGGTVQFRFRVSTENGYDKFYFSIDNIQYISALSGNIPWTLSQVYTLAPGTHTLRWLYTKDGSAAVGEDSVYIDDLDIVPNYDVNITVDTKRSVANSVTFLADTKRQIGAVAEVDTKREVIASVNTATDTLRQIKASVNIAPDTTRKVTHRSLFIADTERIVPLFAIANTDTSRTVLGAITFSTNTTRRMTTHLRDTKVVTVTLAAKTLSDSFDIQTYQPVEIGQVITGAIKGLAYTFVADEVSYDERSKLYQVRGTYDIGNKLGEYITARPGGYYASNIMSSLCSSLGKSLSFQADNFTPSDVVQEGNEFTDTYSGIIGKLFGWTDRVSTMLVNVFERGNTIYVLQRGKESGTVTLAEAECSYPAISRKKMNLLQGGGSNYIYGSESVNTSESGGGESWINGTFGGVTISNGLIVSEYYYAKNEDGGYTQTNTSYRYTSSSPPAKMTEKSTTVKTQYVYTISNNAKEHTNLSTSITTTSNTYNNGNLTYCREVTISEEEIYKYEDRNGNWELVDVRYETTTNQTSTYYASAGQGIWVSTTYRDGRYVGSQMSVGNPGGDASSYAIQRDSMTSSSTIRAYARINGRLNGDNTFPIYGEATIGRIASAINDLHGKIEERVRLTYYGSQLVDFGSLVSFRGNIYYLESNTISQDSRNLSQQLDIVRWY